MSNGGNTCLAAIRSPHVFSWIGRLIDSYHKRHEYRILSLLRSLVKASQDPVQIERRRQKCDKEYGRLILDEAGFHLLKDNRREDEVHWKDVRTIRTFKRDLFAHDVICLEFQVGENERIEIWEYMVDFMDVVKKMQREFPGIPPDWYSVVMVPAFETNERILWQRGDIHN